MTKDPNNCKIVILSLNSIMPSKNNKNISKPSIKMRKSPTGCFVAIENSQKHKPIKKKTPARNGNPHWIPFWKKPFVLNGSKIDKNNSKKAPITPIVILKHETANRYGKAM
uniref:Uncharacterized protein n=1 Tax=viral metagenome TaxID=1070528 RepID=A0A6C0HIN0_9ZZZZ